MKIGKYQLSWMHVALVGILALVLLASYYLPPDARSELRTDAGYVWGGLATLIGPLVRKRVAAEVAAPEGEEE